MTSRSDLKLWGQDALKAHGGYATILEVAKHIWEHHEPELRAHPKLFYTWQYDMRWAAKVLRDHGVLKQSEDTQKGYWELNQP
jgi:hypothetical protein